MAGVRLDGRLAENPSAGQDFTITISDPAKRPKFIRLRFILTDPGIGMSQMLSFTFAMPALAPTP